VPEKVEGEVPAATTPVEHGRARSDVPVREGIEQTVLVRGGKAPELVDDAERVERPDETVEFCRVRFTRQHDDRDYRREA
jgi:hypothetical protein